MFAAILVAVVNSGCPAGEQGLTAWEVLDGFKLLFDGKSLAGWTGFRRSDIPKNWAVEDGTLACSWRDDHGDIRTIKMYGDFDLRLEWKVEPGGNSGIFYRSSEDDSKPWGIGAEYQLLDDYLADDRASALTHAASCYDMFAPTSWVCKPGDQWNETRIVAKGDRVQHWLNGVLVVSYEVGSEDWERRFRMSKFVEDSQFGRNKSGHIVLQDHWQKVWFRHLRIKKL